MQRQASAIQVITQPSQRFEGIAQDLISCAVRDFFIVDKGAKLMGAQVLNFVRRRYRDRLPRLREGRRRRRVTLGQH